MIWFLLHPPASSVTTPTSYSIRVPVSPNFQFLKQDTLSLASQLCQILSLLLGTLLTPTSSYIVLRSQLRHLFLQEAFPVLPGPRWGRRLRCVPSALWSPLSTLRWSHSLAMTGDITDLSHGRKAHQAVPVWATPASGMKRSVWHVDGVQEIVVKRNVTPL